MKKLVVLFAVTLLVWNASAQARFGLRMGGNFASWSSEVEDLPFAELESITAAHFGPYVTIYLSDKFAIEPAVLGSVKGASLFLFEQEMEMGNLITLEETSDVYLFYVDVPVLLRFYIIQGLNIYVGPQFSFHLTNTVESEYEECFNGMCFSDSEDDEAEITGTDLAAAFGIGYEFPFGLNINVGYDVGISDIDDTNTFETNNKVLKASVGWTFGGRK